MTQNLNRKNIITYFTILLVIIFIIVFPYVFGDTAFVLGFDIPQQYSVFYELTKKFAYTLIHNNKLLFWSFDTFLGNDIWSNKLFLIYNDIYNFFFAFFFPNLKYYQVALIETVVKFIVIGTGTILLINNYELNAKTKIIVSLLITFNSYTLFSIYQPMMLSFYSIIPWMLLCIEIYFKRKKTLPITICTIIGFVTNISLMFPLAIFMIIYFLYRYSCITGCLALKKWWKDAFRLSFSCFVGFLIASCITFPIIFSLFSNSRVGLFNFKLFFDDIKSYLQIIESSILPSSSFYNIETFSFGLNLKPSYKEMFDIYTSMVVVILMPQLFINHKKYRTNFVFLLILIFLTFLRPFYTLSNGFSEASSRWLFMDTVMFPILVSPVLNSMEKSSTHTTTQSSFIIILLIVSIPLILSNKQNGSYFLCFSSYQYLAFITISILYFLSFVRKKYMHIYILIIFEICLTCYSSVFGSTQGKQYKKDYINAIESNLGQQGELSDWLVSQNNSNNSQYYRVYIPYDEIYGQYSYNLNLIYDFKGLMTYDTLCEASNYDIDKLSKQSLFQKWSFNITNPYLINFFNTKYAVVTKNYSLPKLNWVEIGDYYGLPVYENLDYYNLIKTYNKIQTYSTYSGDTSQVLNTIICDSDDYEFIQKNIGLAETSGADYVYENINSLVASFTSTENGYATIAIAYDPGWKIIINGVETKYQKVNGGVIGVPIKKGTNIIEMYFIPQGLKLGALISITTSFICIIVAIICYSKKKQTQ